MRLAQALQNWRAPSPPNRRLDDRIGLGDASKEVYLAPAVRCDFDRADERASSLATDSSPSAALSALSEVERVVVSTGGVPWRDFVRWAVCLAFALAAHGSALFLVAQKPDLSDAHEGSPAVFVELAPMPVAPPAPPQDLAPGPLRVQAESSPSVTEDAPPPPLAEKQQAQTSPPDPAPPPPPARDDSEPQVPPREQVPPVEAAPQPPQSETSVASVPPSTQDHADEIKGPAMGSVAAPVSAKVTRWQQTLVAQIERFKRYPPQAHDRFGVARMAFTLDRNGGLVSAHIITSAGSEVLDEEALATIRRAAPFPVPPMTITDGQLSFILPIRFWGANEQLGPIRR